MGQIPQLLSRLFPFTRGLNHAYWAPNVWALVTAFDRVLLKYIQKTGANIPINPSGVQSTSRGLVGDTIFAVIPNVKPIHTFTITIAFQSVILFKLWRNPTYKSFLTALTLCGYVSYLFGWHVHEKAVLLVLVPLSLLAAERQAYFRTFVLASVAGIFSLFPLIFTPTESIIKVLYSFLWLTFVYTALSKRVYEFPKSLSYVILDTVEKAYLGGFVFLQAFIMLFPALSARSKHVVEAFTCIPSDEVICPDALDSPANGDMAFLPLMATSVYCAVGLVWGFIRLMFVYLNEETTYQGQLSTIQ
ncbi:glycosyl transferase [Stygiomarasmius scandens]